MIYKFILLFFCFLSSYAQLKQTTFKEIDSVVLQKPVVVFINTTWCKSCVSMKKKTFTNSELIAELNNNYHFISFDAESKATLSFRGKLYNYKLINKRKGRHELAQALGKHKHRMSYPTLVFLNTDKEVAFRSTTRLKAKELLTLLNELKRHDKI